MYPYPQFVAEGVLMSYGVNVVDEYRHAATYVDRILKGEKLADLPTISPQPAIALRYMKAPRAVRLLTPRQEAY
jgi:putative tryptophan/tyrosine transport system substrate-binding protein